jgi:hypothetical protein
MAWVTIPTFTTAVLTTAQANYIRDNLQETAPAKATQPNQYPVATGVNSLTMRRVNSASVLPVQTTTSTSWTQAGGPAVTVTTGTTALVFVFCQLTVSANSEAAYYGPAVTGDSTITAEDHRAVTVGRYTSEFLIGAGMAVYFTGLTAGSNTFTGMVRVTGGTGTYDNRRIIVQPF